MTTDLPIGFYPFWFWNDALDAVEIRRQLALMAAQGVKGFYIHPRQGLRQPYLSETFFDMVDAALAAAKELNLVVHLYDELPYPSGIAGGEVVLGCPQYYATKLVHAAHLVPGGPTRLALPAGKVLSCVAYPLREGVPDWESGLDLMPHVGVVLDVDSYLETGLTDYNRKRYFSSEPTPTLDVILPAEPHKLYASVQVEVTHFKYWHHYVDVLNPEAVLRFIELTHERYRVRYGGDFGQRIISIFADETEPAWSDRLPEAFQEVYGYDLRKAMPALQEPTHPRHLRVSHDLHQLTYRLFCEAFEEPIAAWCHKCGLAYSGEKPSLRLAQLKYMDIPGCEPGHTKVGTQLDLLQGRVRSNAKATASAAYFYGKVGALCECYHSTGWSATLQDAKFIADGLLLMGIKYLVPHGFFYSTHALKKHDAPPTFFFQMPFWSLFADLAAYVDRIGRLFDGTYIDAEILVVDPASGIPTSQDLQIYESLLWTLMASHLDFHIVDTDTLRTGRIERGRVRVADIAAKVVIMPPMQVVEGPLQAWLDGFENAGGRVIRWNRELAPDTLTAELLRVVRPSLSVQVDGKEAGAVLVVKRAAEDRTLWFLLNTSGETIPAQFRCDGALEEVPLALDLPPTLRKEGERYVRPILPFESLVLEASAAQVQTHVSALPTIRVRVAGPATVELANDNLLRMADWRMALVDSNGEEEQEAVVPAIPLAEQLAVGKFRFRPAVERHFGGAPELTYPELRVRYRHSFNCMYDGPIQLVMEPGSIAGEWAAFVNESGPLEARVWQPTSAHVRGSLGVDITNLLQHGENTLAIEVVTDRSDGGLLNPLYLAGDFGVMLRPTRLVPRQPIGSFEQYEENLLPFYSGLIQYSTQFVLQEVPETDHAIVHFEYDRPFHEATEVSINGGPFKSLAWQPRCVRVATCDLIVGENILETKVYTTLIRSFEGQYFDYQAHVYRDVGA